MFPVPVPVPVPPEMKLGKCRAAQPEVRLNQGGGLTGVGKAARYLLRSILGAQWHQ